MYVCILFRFFFLLLCSFKINHNFIVYFPKKSMILFLSFPIFFSIHRPCCASFTWYFSLNNLNASSVLFSFEFVLQPPLQLQPIILQSPMPQYPIGEIVTPSLQMCALHDHFPIPHNPNGNELLTLLSPQGKETMISRLQHSAFTEFRLWIIKKTAIETAMNCHWNFILW